MCVGLYFNYMNYRERSLSVNRENNGHFYPHIDRNSFFIVFEYTTIHSSLFLSPQNVVQLLASCYALKISRNIEYSVILHNILYFEQHWRNLYFCNDQSDLWTHIRVSCSEYQIKISQTLKISPDDLSFLNIVSNWQMNTVIMIIHPFGGGTQ